MVLEFETKSLRDARSLLNVGIAEAYQVEFSVLGALVHTTHKLTHCPLTLHTARLTTVMQWLLFPSLPLCAIPPPPT